MAIKTRRPQKGSQSGFGSLTWIGREKRWVVRGHVKTPDGKVKRPTLHSFPRAMRTREQAEAAFSAWCASRTADEALHLRLPALDVRALCTAFRERGQEPYRRGEELATHWGFDFATAEQWAAMQGDIRLAEYDGDHFRAFRNALDKLAAMPCDGLKKRKVQTREGVNKKLKAARRIAKWGVSCRLCPPSLFDILKAVEGLKHGQARAKEGDKRKACTVEQFELTAELMPEYGRWALWLLRWSGARPSEVLTLKSDELTKVDENGETLYRADKADHKNAGKGKDRAIYFSPPVVALLDELIAATTPEDPYLFSMARVAASEPGLFRAAKPGAACLTFDLLAGWVTRYAKLAEVDHWTPYQLRHLRSTEIANFAGKEAAQAAAGHSQATMTDTYTKGANAEKTRRLAVEAALTAGG